MAWSSDPARYRTNISQDRLGEFPGVGPGLRQVAGLRAKISDKLSKDRVSSCGVSAATPMALVEEDGEKQSSRRPKRMILPSGRAKWSSGNVDRNGKTTREDVAPFLSTTS